MGIKYSEEMVNYLADTCDDLRDMVDNGLEDEAIQHIETCEDCQELV